MDEDLAKLEQEARSMSDELKDKVVAYVLRQRDKEAIIQFTDGSRLYIEAGADGIELSTSARR